jgi:hypothetical protein
MEVARGASGEQETLRCEREDLLSFVEVGDVDRRPRRTPFRQPVEESA